MSKYFPIRTETACKLKWSWNTLRLYNGATSSCHRVDYDIVGPDNFDSFHNTPKKLNDRKLMLDGKWPTGGCEYCKNVENSGGSSDRQFHLKIPDQYPEILNHSNEINVNPTILEVYLDNVCNMSCLYCWDGFSSKIQQENINFGPFEKAGVVINNKAIKHPEHTQLKEKFWQWLSENYSTLSRLHILGGEPFYQKEFETCLTFLENNTNKNLEFSIISNLMIKPKNFKSQISRIKEIIKKRKIGRFDLTASIDCWGAEQEYVRFGLDLDVWKNNFEYLVSEKWITLNINQTISSLTINTIPELLKYVNLHRINRKIGHYMSMATTTYDFLHPRIFGKGFFNNEFTNIINIMHEETWQQKEAKKYLLGIKSYLDTCERNQAEINKLGIYLDELDRRRNTNWRTTFPWLEQEIKDVV
jgi:organic radical activating enzyme